GDGDRRAAGPPQPFADGEARTDRDEDRRRAEGDDGGEGDPGPGHRRVVGGLVHGEADASHPGHAPAPCRAKGRASRTGGAPAPVPDGEHGDSDDGAPERNGDRAEAGVAVEDGRHDAAGAPGDRGDGNEGETTSVHYLSTVDDRYDTANVGARRSPTVDR